MRDFNFPSIDSDWFRLQTDLDQVEFVKYIKEYIFRLYVESSTTDWAVFNLIY